MFGHGILINFALLVLLFYVWGFSKNANNGVIKLKIANKLDHPRREAKVLIILKMEVNAFSCLLGFN